MELGKLSAFLRRLAQRDTIEGAEGNAFYGGDDLVAGLQRMPCDQEAVFIEGVRAAEEWFGDQKRDPFEAVRENRLPYTQAALAFLQWRAHEVALAAGALDKLVLRAGYSFGSYTLFMLNAGADGVTTTHGGYARARAQEQSCKSAGIRSPYQHLFTFPNDDKRDEILTELSERHPTHRVAIAAPARLAIASLSRIEEPYDWIPDMRIVPHPPYHHPTCMAGATALFRVWLDQHVDMAKPAPVPLVSGLQPARVIIEGGTLGDQATLITEEIGRLVTWIEVVQLFANKNIVTLVLGERAPKMSKLQLVSGGRMAPGNWSCYVV